MDMLVLIMLALFLIIIAFVVIIYVVARRNAVDKQFNRKIESDLETDLEDDDEFENINIVMPSGFQNVILEKREDEKTDVKEEVKKDEIVFVEDLKEEKVEEVINVLINKRNYIFLANNNYVSKNDHIKLILDGKVYFGTITKANYKRDISNFKIKPKKLIIIKKIEKKDDTLNSNQENKLNREEIIEFVPKKKDRI